MLIDPSQPIIFDTDTAPGRGIGYWQINPRRSYFLDDGVEDGDETGTPEPESLTTKVTRRLFLAIVFGGIAIGAADMLLR